MTIKARLTQDQWTVCVLIAQFRTVWTTDGFIAQMFDLPCAVCDNMQSVVCWLRNSVTLLESESRTSKKQRNSQEAEQSERTKTIC